MARPLRIEFAGALYRVTARDNAREDIYRDDADRRHFAEQYKTRDERMAGVMVSAEDYEAMRVFYADRLRQTLRESAAGVAVAGLTEDKLAELLADES